MVISWPLRGGGLCPRGFTRCIRGIVCVGVRGIGWMFSVGFVIATDSQPDVPNLDD